MADSTLTESRLTAAAGSVRGRLVKTGAVCRTVVRRRDSAAVLTAVTLTYLAVFLWALGDLLVQSGVGYSIFVADRPLARAFRPAPGAFLFQPVALVELGVVVWELSPLNTLLGGLIASLVGLNLSVSYLAVTQPKSCGLSASAGILASVPGLLAGSTCCAPVLLLVVGIQASGILLTAFVWLLPASLLLLVATLVYVAGKITPAAL